MNMRWPFSTRLYLSHKTSIVRPFPVRSVVTVGFSIVSFPKSFTALLVPCRDVAKRVEHFKGDTRRYKVTENTTASTHGRPALLRLALVTPGPTRGSMPSFSFEMRFLVISGSLAFGFMTRTFAEVVVA